MSDREITFKEAIVEALEEELARDPSLVVIGEDIQDVDRRVVGGELSARFPGRVIIHLPLVEDMLCGIGLGMSLGGLKPIIQFDRAILLTLAAYEIFKIGTWRYRLAEKNGPSVVIRVGHFCGIGGPEFTTTLFSTLLSIPNIWIAAPAFAYHAKGLLKTAIRANRPVLFIEDKHPRLYDREELLPKEEYTLPFPQAVVSKTGKDLTIISWQVFTFLAMDAAEELKKEKISAEVISLQTLQPMDTKTILDSAKKTGRVLIVEAGPLRGGIGAEISAKIAEILPGLRTKRLASQNVPLPYALKHLRLILPGKEDIIKACQDMMR